MPLLDRLAEGGDAVGHGFGLRLDRLERRQADEARRVGHGRGGRGLGSAAPLLRLRCSSPDVLRGGRRPRPWRGRGGRRRGGRPRRRHRERRARREDLLDRDESGQLGEPEEEDLQRERRDVAAAEHPLRLGEERQHAQERGVGRRPRHVPQRGGAVFGDPRDAGRRRVGGEPDGPADERRQVVGRGTRVRPRGLQLGGAPEDRRPVAGENRRQEGDEGGPVGGAEKEGDVARGDAATRLGDRLVEEREPVAQAPRRRGGERREGGGLDPGRRFLRRVDGVPLAVGDLGEPVSHLGVGEAPEVEALAAGEDRRRDLVPFRRREDEDGVRRRLLERLQERLERRRRDGVDLVDDEDLPAVPHRRVADDLDQVARLVDLAVRGAVDLEGVDGAPLEDLHARLARPARARGRSGGGPAVDAGGEEARRGRLPDAARPREEVGVSHPVLGQGVRQGTDDLGLSHDVRERPGAPLSREGDEGVRRHERTRAPR